ncbi:MAG: hypothetical protein WCE30_01945 [Mycobacterium sp.]
MANNQNIQVDHEEVDQWCHRSDSIHDEYGEVLKLLDEVVADVTAEAAKYTQNGAPAPIYQNTVEQTKTAVGHLKEQIVKHQDNMTKDSQTLLKYSQQVKEADAEFAAKVGSAYRSMDRGSESAGTQGIRLVSNGTVSDQEVRMNTENMERIAKSDLPGAGMQF